MRISEGQYALGSFTVFVVWLFVVLPFLYGPPPRFAEPDHPPQSHSEQHKQASTGEPRGTLEAPFFVKVLPAPKTAEEAAEEAQERREKASTDWWLMAFTGAVAFFTLALVIATTGLYWAGERQMRLIERNAAQQSAEVRILQRAYISVKPLGVEPHAIGAFAGATVGIENVGNLAARKASWVVFRKFSRKDDLQWLPINDRRYFAGGSTIPPKTTVLKSPLRISASRIAKYKRGVTGRDRFLYVWGEVRYNDGFVDGRSTRFCHRYNLAAEKDLRIHFKDARHHEYGNHTDEDLPQPPQGLAPYQG